MSPSKSIIFEQYFLNQWIGRRGFIGLTRTVVLSQLNSFVWYYHAQDRLYNTKLHDINDLIDQSLQKPSRVLEETLQGAA